MVILVSRSTNFPSFIPTNISEIPGPHASPAPIPVNRNFLDRLYHRC